MRCEHCGNELREGARICFSCGALQDSAGAELPEPASTPAAAQDVLVPDPGSQELSPATTEPVAAPTRQPLRPFWRAYYWANLVLNPVLVLLLFSESIGESMVGILSVWIVISALLSPELRSCCISVGASLGIAIVFLALGLLGLGSIAAIVVALVLISVGGGLIASALLVLSVGGLWVAALVRLIQDRRLRAAAGAHLGQLH